MSNTTGIDSANLKDMSVEDLLAIRAIDVEEVTDFVPFPTAAYRFEVKGTGIESVGKDEKACIEVELTITEVQELDNPEEESEVGELPREYTERFMLEQVKNGFGVRSFVTFVKPLAVAQGNPEATVNEMMEMVSGATGVVLIKRRAYTNDAGEQRVVNNLGVTSVLWD